MKIPRAYGGVTFLTAFITGNYLVLADQERIYRQKLFDADHLHFRLNQEMHIKEVGDDLANMGFPDDGNG